MAIRNIRTLGDEILRKEAKEITEMTPRIQELIDDMFETMYEANGVGLAAPQVGIRKRLVVIDCGDDPRLRHLMKIWKRLSLRVKNFLQDVFYTRLIILTE